MFPPKLMLDQIVIREQPQSQGRGASLPPVPDLDHGVVGADLAGGMPPFAGAPPAASAQNGAVPEGITPLERDIFNSDDFYKDRDLWMDPRYYHCMSPFGIENVWGSYRFPTIGDNPPETIAWGYCDRDYAREDIVSPYPYKTAQEHYDALLAEAKSRGGPTQYSQQNPPPDWNGNYNVNGFGQRNSTRGWVNAQISQIPTYLSLLTPEYQQRMVQQMWHDAHDEVIWNGAFCWPDGFQRRWFGGDVAVLVTPHLVEMRSKVNESIVTDIYVGREFDRTTSVPTLSGDTRQYYGDSIGFWDGDALITWTSNIKGWLNHGWWETSDQMQVIEVYTPIDGPDGKFAGLLYDAVVYDPEALVEPIRIVEKWELFGDFDVPALPIGTPQCVQTLFPVDGKQAAFSPGDVVPYTVPDFSGRPWADVWAVSEKNMDRPKADDALAGF